MFASPLAAQQLPVVGIKPGTDSIIVTATSPNGTTLRKAQAVIVVFGQPVSLFFWKGARIVNQARVLVPFDQIDVDEVGCIYVTAQTSRGTEIPGLPTAPTIPDSSMMAFRAKNGFSCPNSTLLSSQVPILPPL